MQHLRLEGVEALLSLYSFVIYMLSGTSIAGPLPIDQPCKQQRPP